MEAWKTFEKVKKNETMFESFESYIYFGKWSTDDELRGRG